MRREDPEGLRARGALGIVTHTLRRLLARHPIRSNATAGSPAKLPGLPGNSSLGHRSGPCSPSRRQLSQLRSRALADVGNPACTSHPGGARLPPGSAVGPGRPPGTVLHARRRRGRRLRAGYAPGACLDARRRARDPRNPPAGGLRGPRPRTVHLCGSPPGMGRAGRRRHDVRVRDGPRRDLRVRGPPAPRRRGPAGAPRPAGAGPFRLHGRQRLDRARPGGTGRAVERGARRGGRATAGGLARPRPRRNRRPRHRRRRRPRLRRPRRARPPEEPPAALRRRRHRMPHRRRLVDERGRGPRRVRGAGGRLLQLRPSRRRHAALRDARQRDEGRLRRGLGPRGGPRRLRRRPRRRRIPLGRRPTTRARSSAMSSGRS